MKSTAEIMKAIQESETVFQEIRNLVSYGPTIKGLSCIILLVINEQILGVPIQVQVV